VLKTPLKTPIREKRVPGPMGLYTVSVIKRRPDGMHPNALGAQIGAEAIHKYLSAHPRLLAD